MTYVNQRVLSIGLPLLILLGGLFLWTGTVESFWSFLWMIIIPLGYTHYVIGAGYQYRSLNKSERPGRFKTIFWFVVAFSVVLSVILLRVNPVLFTFVILSIFVVHGILSEYSLWQRTGMPAVSPYYFYAIGVPMIGVLLLSLPHPSTFYTVELNAQTFINPEAVIYLVSAYIPIWLVSWSTLIAFFMGAICTWVALARRTITTRISTLLCYVVACYILIALSPLPNVYIQFVFLAYHFIAWGLYFGLVFYQRDRAAYNQYVRYHLIILAPMWVLAVAYHVVEIEALQSLFTTVFSMQMFTIGTAIHIFTSFLNEPNFRTWLKV